MCYVLFVDCCDVSWLLVVGRWLLVIGHWLLDVGCCIMLVVSIKLLKV